MNKIDIYYLLKNKKLRLTTHRERVLELLIEAPHALTSNSIEEKVKDIDRITLYRTLRSFEEKGLVHKIVDSNNIAKYALCIDECSENHHHDHHVHFHCESCDNTFCLDGVKVPFIELPPGYTAKSKSMMINGVCEKCA